MTEKLNNTEALGTAPFQEEIALEFFYNGGSRGEVLSTLNWAMSSAVPILIVTGDEGSGKTTICRMFEQQLPPDCTAVVFSETVESFEDVVRIIAMRLGLNPATTVEGKHVEAVVNQIANHLIDRSESVVVVFGEAENLYLATLERVRKMLDRVTGAGARLHLLFFGRKTFLENCDQLTICDFETTEEKRFDLPPLSFDETMEYLQQVAMQIEDVGGGARIFTEEVVRSIYDLAKGNFKMTNILAEESIKTHGDDTSFMALLETVKEETGSDVEEKSTFSISRLYHRYRTLLPYVICGVAAVLVLAIYFGSGDSVDTSLPADASVVAPIKDSKTETAEDEIQSTVQIDTGPQNMLEDGSETAPQEVTAVVRVSGDDAEEGGKGEPAIQDIQEGVSVPRDTGPAKEVLPQTDSLAEAVPANAGNSGLKDTVKPDASSIQVPAQQHIVELKPKKILKKKAGSLEEPRRGVIHVQPRTEVQDIIVANAHYTVEQLFEKRGLAGAVWETGAKNDMYTVQLMVLTAKNAEKNLKKMLAQTNYRQEAGNFFIFKNNNSPPHIFVFYGEYPTMAMARLAQNSLPAFLRSHSQPYAISIKGAIAKVQK